MMKEHRLEVPAVPLEPVLILHSTSLANLQLDYCLLKHSHLDSGGIAVPYDLPFSKDPELMSSPLHPPRKTVQKLLTQHLVVVELQQLDPSPLNAWAHNPCVACPATEYLKRVD